MRHVILHILEGLLNAEEELINTEALRLRYKGDLPSRRATSGY